MATLIQPSFAKGEIAPALYGRVDTAAYQIALKTARNIVIRAYGGASNRTGLSFVGPVKDFSYAPRLIEFQFKTSDTYLLEFGDEYMRVIRNGGHVLEDAQDITGITAAEPPVVTSAAHGFSNGDEVYIESVVGMTELNQRRFIVRNVATNTFELESVYSGADIDATGYTAYTSGGTVARVLTVTSPYAIEDVDRVKVVQSADVMTLTHPDYAPRELTRTSHTSWNFSTPSFRPSLSSPAGVAVASGGGSVTRRYRVTALKADTLEETLPGLNTALKTITAITQADPAVVTSAAHGFSNGDEIEINSVLGMTQVNGRRFFVQNVATNTFELQDEDSTGYGAYSSGGTAAQTFVRTTTSADPPADTITWSAREGAARYSVYVEQNGVFGWIGDTELLTFTNDNIAPDLDTSPPSARNPFLLADSFPAAAGYFDQRRVFGGSNDEPDTSYYSKVGSQSNFSSSAPAQDDDAITATLNSLKVNEIRHYVTGDDLLIFTSGSVWQVNSGSDTSFSATTLKQHPQSVWGCSHLAPIVVNKTILHVTENDSSVRSMGFSWQQNGYTGNDVSLLSGHLFETYKIVDSTFARFPDPVAHYVREDGQAACMTFNQEQEMIAWTRWDTQGKFERVCSLRQQDPEIDEAVYFVVKRVIGGRTVRYIERTHSRRFTDVRDCFFVDAGVSYDDPKDITDITLADPPVVTSAGHGFSNGDEVDIFDVQWVPTFDDDDGSETQPDQLNGKRFIVANATTDTFELSGADSSDFDAYVEGGTARKAVLTVSGGEHLEGEEVSVLADGNVITNITVTDGQITLPRKFSRVHYGLRYIADLETLDIEAPGAGTIQGKLKKIAKATIRFERSRGLLYGPNSSQLTEMKQREFENMGDPTALLTGDKEVTFEPSWNTEGRVFLRQKYPLPMTILAIIPDLAVSR